MSGRMAWPDIYSSERRSARDTDAIGAGQPPARTLRRRCRRRPRPTISTMAPDHRTQGAFPNRSALSNPWPENIYGIYSSRVRGRLGKLKLRRIR